MFEDKYEEKNVKYTVNFATFEFVCIPKEMS